MKGFKIITLVSILVPNFVLGATLGSFDDGYLECYKYSEDYPAFTITYSGSPSQTQVQVVFDSGYTPNGGELRYVMSGGASPKTGTLNWSGAYDGVSARPWHATDVRYYSDSDGFSSYDTVDFVVQDTDCPDPDPEPTVIDGYLDPTVGTSTDNEYLGGINFGLSIIIVILSIYLIAYIFNTFNKKKKPWA